MDNNIQQIFIAGDEWLYYKFYTGAKTADKILSNIIKPITEQLLSNSIIDKWFFIRYADPKQHIRVRFHYTKPQYVFNIIQVVNTFSKPYIVQNLLWKVQLDTYQREIERYGVNTMELSESLFYHDSNMIVSMLNFIDGDRGEKIRWLFSIRAIDTLLSDFNLSIPDKHDLLKNLADNLGKEFGLNSFLIKQLSNKYRKERKLINDILNREKDNESNIKPLFHLLDIKSSTSKVMISKILIINKNKNLQVTLDHLLRSYIHMMMNRIFKSKHRLHEMVIYGFLFRHYKSEIAKQKYSKTNTFQAKNVHEILT